MNQFFKNTPSGWAETTLGKVIDFKYGKSLPAQTRTDGNYFVYGSNGIIGNHSDSLTKGISLIIGRKGSIGEVHISEDPCWPIDTTYYVEELYGQPHKFWFYLLQSLSLSEMNRATAMPGLNRNDAYKASLKIPPINEQKRIVARIEELQARSGRAREALSIIPDLLDQLRQSILVSAFRGDLTKEWREKNPDIEPATELLKRIRAEHRKRWEEAELKKLKSKGFTEEKLKEAFAARRKQYKEPAPVDTEHLSELPHGWCWTRISLAGDVKLGRQRAPKYHTGKYMRKYLRVQNVFEDKLDLSDVMEMDFPPDDYERYRLTPGDILLNEGQSLELVGRPAMYQGEIPGACFTNTLIQYRPYSPIVPDYALLLFINYLHTGRFRKIATISTNIAHLSVSRFADIEFPLPPVEEQKQIASVLRTVMERVKDLSIKEKSILSALSDIDESILSKAFLGDLVPQDPDDEPASALLERIRLGKADAAEEPKAEHKRKSKK